MSDFYNSPILHSGKLYRAVAYEIIEKKIKISDKKSILKILNSLNIKKLNSNNLYSSEIDKISSVISSKKYLREKLSGFQRGFPKILQKIENLQLLKGGTLEL